MDIILDSNIIFRSDFLLKPRPFQLLFDFMEKTRSNFIMTQIVWEEIIALYRKAICERYASLQTAQRKLCNILMESQEELSGTKLDIDKNVEEYKHLLQTRMGFSEQDIVPYHDRYLGDLVTRAINRRKPCTETGKEFRDALLWLSVLDIAESKETKTVVFISDNKHQFAAEKSHTTVTEKPDSTLLHPDLIEEVSARGISVIYHTSLDSFLKSQGTTVDYVTKDWLILQLRQYKIADDLVDMLNEYADDDFKDKLEEYDRDISLCGVGDALIRDIKDFFIYETSSGSYFVVAVVLFHIIGSFDYEKEVEEPDYDTDVDDEGRMISYVSGSYTRLETGSEDFEGQIKVTLSIILRDKSLNKVHIENWEIVNVSN